MVARYRKYEVAHRSIYAKLLRQLKRQRGEKYEAKG